MTIRQRAEVAAELAGRTTWRCARPCASVTWRRESHWRMNSAISVNIPLIRKKFLDEEHKSHHWGEGDTSKDGAEPCLNHLGFRVEVVVRYAYLSISTSLKASCSSSSSSPGLGQINIWSEWCSSFGQVLSCHTTHINLTCLICCSFYMWFF